VKDTIKRLLRAIEKERPERPLKVMHVCGSHEHTVQRWGIRGLLPDGIEVIAGPGCPVCVCPAFEIGEAIELARRGVIITTYGDMMRVPTPFGSLHDAVAEGADIRVVYSPLEAVRIAIENQDKEVVFFSVGFETTAAPLAGLIYAGRLPGNLSFLTAHRLTPPAMELLLQSGDVRIDGFIAPGHVSVIIGSEAWRVFPDRYGMPVAVAGFEPVEFLSGLLLLIARIKRGEAGLDNAYPSVVKPSGNTSALNAMNKTFKKEASWWRGIGEVPRSGLVLRSEYAEVDARNRFGIKGSPDESDLPSGCSCNLVMLGKIYPDQCPLFNKKCTPSTPYGPCMVSQEGTCLIWSRFRTI
jgi:hydrogenase expression/formation protein HypD